MCLICHQLKANHFTDKNGISTVMSVTTADLGNNSSLGDLMVINTN
ncbi:hypothetical protein BH18THE1_BH18THE1_01060 [soil metagenome]